MYLTVTDAGGLGSKELHLVNTEHGQDSHRKEHDTQAAQPLRKAAPEEQRMRLAFNIIKNRSTCCRKTRHGLEKSIRKTWDVPAEPIRQTSEQRKCNPACCNGNVTVASRKFPLTPLADDVAPYPGECSSQCRDEESKQIIPL